MKEIVEIVAIPREIREISDKLTEELPLREEKITNVGTSREERLMTVRDKRGKSAKIESNIDPYITFDISLW